MAAGTTYEPIQTYTLGGTQATVSFTSIPQTYTDLVIVLNAAFNYFAPQASGGMQLNSDTGANYSYTVMQGNGTTASASGASGNNWMYFGECSAAGNPFSVNIINVMNYSNTTTTKAIISRSGLSHSRVMFQANHWNNTSAITRIDLLAFGGTSVAQWVTGSTFTLYGIAAA